MPQSVKVSVIVPVYNAQQHLEQCLDSIIRQTLTDIEIICVDDGSTDASPDILKRYQDSDSRISVYRQANLYAGAARNNGKSHASGKYLAFWDSDDYFVPEALEKMYEQCEKDEADICVCGARHFLEDRQAEISNSGHLLMKYIPETVPFNRLTNPDYILNFTTGNPWNKLYRRSYIEALHLDFQEIPRGNDLYFVTNALCLAERITIVNEELVIYRRNQSNSLTATLSRSPLVPLQAWFAIKDNLTKQNAFPERSFANRVLGNIHHLLSFMDSWESFQTLLDFLQKGGLDKLSIREQEDDYYYTKWHSELVQHLLHDSPEEFLAYYAHFTGIQKSDNIAVSAIRGRQIQNLKNKNAELKERNAVFKERNAVLKERNGNFRQKNTELKNKNAALEKELSALKEKNAALEKQNRETENKLQELKASWSYRIGHQIMRGPGKIKKLFSH